MRLFASLNEQSKPGWGANCAQRYSFFLFFSFFVFSTTCSASQNVTLGVGSGDLTILNPGVDQGKLLCLLSRCMIDYASDFGGYLLTYNAGAHVAQFDNSSTFYPSTGSSVNDGDCQLQSLSVAPCIYTSASNLDAVGDCYIWLYMVGYWRWATNPYTVNSACYKVSGYGQTLTYEQIEALTIQRVTSPSDWIYPIYLNITGQGNSNFSSYLTQNVPSNINSSSPYYAAQSQQAAQLLQMSPHWSASWMLACVANTGAGTVASAWQTIKQRLAGNQIIWLDANHTVPVWGGRPAETGVAGYITIPFATWSVLTDFDKGGQVDWSEYYRGMDMRDPADDNPNFDGIDINVGEIAALEPDKRPGQDNLEPIFEHELTLPGAQDWQGVLNQVETEVNTRLSSNAAFRQLQTVISPDGFNRSQRLPRYQQQLQFNVFGQSWDLGTLDVDLNFLDNEPYKSFWQQIRAILCFSLFVMTFIACYAMYEKSLAFSV